MINRFASRLRWKLASPIMFGRSKKLLLGLSRQPLAENKFLNDVIAQQGFEGEFPPEQAGFDQADLADQLTLSSLEELKASSALSIGGIPRTVTIALPLGPF